MDGSRAHNRESMIDDQQFCRCRACVARPTGALQLLAASAGAGILTIVTKDIIERTRPEQAQHLIAVSGFSYPSGHSLSTTALYITIAIIARRYVQHSGARTSVLLAVSRIHIGIAFRLKHFLQKQATVHQLCKNPTLSGHWG